MTKPTTSGEWVDSEQRPFGWFSPEEGALYLETVKQYPHGILVELGSYLGRSLSYVLPSCRELDIDIWAIDSWPSTDDMQPALDGQSNLPASNLELFNANMRRLNVEALKVCQMSSLEAASDFENDSVSVILIDTLHSYEHTKAEITAWLPKLTEGGSFLFHDYTSTPIDRPEWKTDVGTAVRELLGKPDRIVDVLALVKKK